MAAVLARQDTEPVADVADAPAEATLAELRRWAVRRLLADGALPVPPVHGIPDRCPHVAAALLRAGFVAGERTEMVLAAAVDDLPHGGPPPLDALALEVALGGHGTRFTAVLDDTTIGIYEAGWSDTGPTGCGSPA